MKFLHSSKNEITKIAAARELGCSLKPRGCLWLSCGDAWQEFVAREALNRQYKYLYEVKINSRKLVKLSTSRQMKAFQERFGMPCLTNGIVSGSKTGLWVTPPKNKQSQSEYVVIDWDKVRHATGKCGIWIPNPRQDWRPDLNMTALIKSEWFTGFEICSAAIWDSKCIVTMNQISHA
jgi:hypothetical protein